MEPRLRVLLVDDHPIMRHGVRQILLRADDILVVGEAGNGEEALKQVEQLHPELLIMDIEMPEMDGLEAARRLRETKSPVLILILSAYASKVFVQEAIKIGVDGYLLKDDAPGCLIDAVRRIARGEKGIFSPRIGPP